MFFIVSKLSTDDDNLYAEKNNKVRSFRLAFTLIMHKFLTGIFASASFKTATIWFPIMRFVIIKFLDVISQKILQTGCIIVLLEVAVHF